MEVLQAIVVKRLGRVAYEEAWRSMREFTSRRTEGTADELWLLEHPPVPSVRREVNSRIERHASS